MSIKAIIVDISDTLLTELPGSFSVAPVPGTIEMIEGLQDSGLEVFLASNDNHNQEVKQHYRVDDSRILSPQTVGGKKGTGSYVNYVCRMLGIETNELLYLGDVEQDMWEAVRGNLLFFRADWSNNARKTKYGIVVSAPNKFVPAIAEYFLKESIWYYKVDSADSLGRPVEVRALLNPDKAKNAGIHALLKEKKSNPDLATHLSLHLLASLYIEGLHLKGNFAKVPLWCLYPGHAGAQTGALESFAAIGASLTKVHYLADIIQRHSRARKSAFARFNEENLTIENQLKTIKLNEGYKSKIAGSRILVFDDFTTDAHSFETARNFLLNAGAAEVVCIAVGKYGSNYSAYTPRDARTWNSFQPTNLAENDFNLEPLTSTVDLQALNEF